MGPKGRPRGEPSGNEEGTKNGTPGALLDNPTFAAMANVFEASGTPRVHREQLLHELLPHTP